MACDGSAWSFVYYINNEVVWKRELGYTYGINELVKIGVLIMKRWLSVLVVFSCIIVLSGCENGTKKGQAYFNARVLEVNKGYVDVRCIESFNSGISVDEEFPITKDVASGKGVPELNVDDNIRVVFNGEIMESYPLKLGTVYAIYLLDENGEVLPNN